MLLVDVADSLWRYASCGRANVAMTARVTIPAHASPARQQSNKQRNVPDQTELRLSAWSGLQRCAFFRLPWAAETQPYTPVQPCQPLTDGQANDCCTLKALLFTNEAEGLCLHPPSSFFRYLIICTLNAGLA